MTKKPIKKNTQKFDKKIRSIHVENINIAHEGISKAYLIIKHANDSTKALLESFQIIRKAKKAKGSPTDEESDMLRAMLVFAGAGLDAMTKQLFRDALPLLVDLDEAVANELEKFVSRQIKGENDILPSATGASFLAKVLVAPNSQEHLLDQYIQSLTGGSMQSVAELRRASNALGIRSKVFKTSEKQVQAIFHIRNQIVHDLDINFAEARRNRHIRRIKDMISYSNVLLAIGESILANVSNKFKELE